MIRLRVVQDNVKNLDEAIKTLSSTHILVGIPSDDEQPHYGSGSPQPNTRQPAPGVSKSITNAVLGYIHELGSPARNIPARPWLVPAIQSKQTETSDLFQQAGKAAFEGRLDTIDRIFHAIGLLNQSAVKTRIAQGIPPPLKPSTIRNRLRKSTLSAKKKAALTAADFTPLIDTGQFVNSVSYVLRKVKK